MTRTSLAALLLLTSTAAAQDQIHYKFDSVGSPTIVNYATSPNAALTATVKYGARHGYVKGHFGPGALRAAMFGVMGNFVDSGWEGPLSGSATFAFFLKNHYANTPTIRSGFIGRKGFGISTGGEAKGGLMMKGWGGQILKVHFGTDLCYLTGWHHYAIVIDAQQKKARWYWDGKLFKTESIAAGVRFIKADNLLIGRDHIDHCGSRYDMDEFRFVARAVPAAEIRKWATKSTAASGGYGKPVSKHDLVAHGVPALGNSGYRLQLTAAPKTPFALAWGLSRVRFGSLALPIELGAGRQWHTSVALFVPGVIDEGGVSELPIPIPSDPGFDQAAFHTQAILAKQGGGFGVTNAIAHTIGH